MYKFYKITCIYFLFILIVYILTYLSLLSFLTSLLFLCRSCVTRERITHFPDAYETSSCQNVATASSTFSLLGWINDHEKRWKQTQRLVENLARWSLICIEWRSVRGSGCSTESFILQNYFLAISDAETRIPTTGDFEKSKRAPIAGKTPPPQRGSKRPFQVSLIRASYINCTVTVWRYTWQTRVSKVKRDWISKLLTSVCARVCARARAACVYASWRHVIALAPFNA